MMVIPPRLCTRLCRRCNSSGAIEVPVGLDGEASKTPRVCVPQAAATLSVVS